MLVCLFVRAPCEHLNPGEVMLTQGGYERLTCGMLCGGYRGGVRAPDIFIPLSVGCIHRLTHGSQTSTLSTRARQEAQAS